MLRVLIGTAQHLRPMHNLTDRITRRLAFYGTSPQRAVQQVRPDFLRTRRRVLVRTTLASPSPSPSPSPSHDGVRLARKLDVPVLVLHGDHDPEVPSREARELVNALPVAELVNLSGAPHMLPLTDPGRVCEPIRRWMKRASHASPDASPPPAAITETSESR